MNINVTQYYDHCVNLLHRLPSLKSLCYPVWLMLCLLQCSSKDKIVLSFLMTLYGTQLTGYAEDKERLSPAPFDCDFVRICISDLLGHLASFLF